ASAPPPPSFSSNDFVSPTRNLPRGSQSAAKPKTESKKAEKEDRKPAGKWVVQVGAFKSKSLAKEQLTLVEKRFGKHFGKADGATDSVGGTYRARFKGFTEASAKDACGALKAKKVPCMVVKPG
ncbi:MAG TPA: SPOR domain-containing protein, partial [Phenylobacterium sp.]|nr:SPOR domain-containing protein [Phenylobacterium sp.]